MAAPNAPSPAAAAPPAKPRRFSDSTTGFFSEWSVTILLLLFGTTTLVQAFVVPTGSMEGTILIGDHLLVDKLAYAPSDSVTRHLLPYQDVKRGDIICFKYPLNIRETYVKRVVGMPGDRIRIVNKQVYINDKPLYEPYKVHIRDYSQPYFDYFPGTPPDYVFPEAKAMIRDNVIGSELIIPPQRYFAMGDNRDNSADSRWWGFVPRENIVGKPVLIFWSYETSTENLSTVLPTAEHAWDLATNFFRKTRWERTFQLVRPYRYPAHAL